MDQRFAKHLRSVGAWVLVALWLTSLPAPAQEAIRMSMTGEAAAEARRRAAATFGYYNLKLGPLAMRFDATAGIQYHDNIRYTEANRLTDFILRPEVNTAMRWTITEKNSLNVNFGLGYLKYLKYSEFDRSYIAPGSEIGFDLYVGDFLINFHDRVTMRTDVGEIPVARSQGDYQRLENVIGVTANWDLNTIIFTLGYDHADYLSLNQTLRTADGSSEIIFARGSLALSADSTIGPELGVTSVDYSDSRVNDALQYNGGLFYQSKFTRHLEFKVRAGYTFYETQAGGFVQHTQGSGNPYVDLSVSHLVGAFMNHTLSVGHNVRTGLEYGSRTRPLTVTYANWHPTWKFLHEVQLATPVSFEYGEDNGAFAEQYSYFSAGLTAGRMLSAKLSGRVTYRFVARDSNYPGGDYWADIVSLLFTYRF